MESVVEVRQIFENKFKESIDNGTYDERDVTRLRDDDKYVECFITHQHDDYDRAVAMIDSSMRWRNELKVNDLTEKSFPLQLHESGAIFYHNRDKKGNQILNIRVAKYKKSSENSALMKKFAAWHIDKVFRRQAGERLVVLFDMTDASLSNVDVEVLKFQIACFTTYYPSSLAYILVYEMPWVLSAVWSVIKKILTPAQQKFVIMVKKSQITEYIDPNQLFTHMGGTDSFVYSYIPSEDSGLDVNGESDAEKSLVSSGEFNSAEPDPVSCGGLRKRVAFECDQNTEHKTNGIVENGLMNGSSVNSTCDENQFCGSLVTIRPGDKLTFYVHENGGRDTMAHMNIKNTADISLSYKIKTTSPDSYRVKPHIGIIGPGGSTDINVTLLAGQLAIQRDKFLVMVVSVNDEQECSVAALNALWKNVARESPTYMEHRLMCHVEAVSHPLPSGDIDSHSFSLNSNKTSSSRTAKRSVPESPMEVKINEMLDRQMGLESQMRTLIKLQLFTVFILFVIILYAMS